MNVGAILNEVGQALTTTGIGVYTSVPDAGEYPALVVNPPTLIEYTQTHAGGCTITVPVTLYVQTADLATAWSLVYKLLSYDSATDTPVADALLSHTPTHYRTLQVTQAGNFRPVAEAGIAVDITLIIRT